MGNKSKAELMMQDLIDIDVNDRDAYEMVLLAFKMDKLCEKNNLKITLTFETKCDITKLS